MNCDEHTSLNCPLAVIDCEFKGVGCEMKLFRKEMAAHLSESTIHHLSLVAYNVSDLIGDMHEHAQDIETLQIVTNLLNRSVKESC